MQKTEKKEQKENKDLGWKKDKKRTILDHLVYDYDLARNKCCLTYLSEKTDTKII